MNSRKRERKLRDKTAERKDRKTNRKRKGTEHRDESYVVEDGDRVSPTHREFGETEGTIWCLESGVVAGHLGESTFVVSDIQVEHSSAGTTCKLLGDLFGEGSDAGMLDRDGIEWFEAVDRTNSVGFFLRYAEPARVV